DQARSLGQTAQLRFREVVGGPVAAAPAAASGQPAAPASGEPTAPAGVPGASGTPVPASNAPSGSTLPPQGAPAGLDTPAGPDESVHADVVPVALAQP